MQERLQVYRRTLRALLQQAAQYGGEAFTPIHIVNNIHEVRENIQQIKATLRAEKQVVDDWPDDEPNPGSAPSDRNPPTSKPISGKKVGCELKIIVMLLFAVAITLILPKVLPNPITIIPTALPTASSSLTAGIPTHAPVPTGEILPTILPTAIIIPTAIPVTLSTPAGALIDNFENGINDWYTAQANTNGWNDREVAQNVNPSNDAASGNGALQCEFDFNRSNEQYPRAICFRSFALPQDWTSYSTLRFQAKSLVDPGATNIRVSIALATRDDSCWNELPNDFKALGTGYQTFAFNLDTSRFRNCVNNFGSADQPLVGKDQVRRLHLIFMAENKPAGAVLIDDIQLIK